MHAKTLLCLVLAYLLSAHAILAQTSVAPASGTGTLADPYQITQLGNLVWMSDNATTEGVAGKYYKLMNDIDASDTANWNGGFTPIGSDQNHQFVASFDGNGKKIVGLTILRAETDYVGLFSILGPRGEVRDLALVGGTVTGDSFVGGLAGLNMGTVTNCSATGEVRGDYIMVGGLFGLNYGSVVKCYATGAVSGSSYAGGLIGICVGPVTECCATGAVTGLWEDSGELGGLVGKSEGAITDCYATGAVTGNGYIGGLVGHQSKASITNCYATGVVIGYTGGGLVGYNDLGTTVTNSYWDIQTSGLSTSAGGLGRSTSEMKQQTTFSGWNFVNVWRIREGISYPYLVNLEQPPFVPVNVAPPNGASAVPLATTLIASAFMDPNTTDTHAATQWQVGAAASPSSWTVTVSNSGAGGISLTTCPLPPGTLASLTDYWWHVRYEDDHGMWSAWSAPTGFRTRQEALAAPTGVAASDGTFPDRVRVIWTAAAGAPDYRVYRSTHPTTATATALAGWATGTSHDDLTAERHVIYYYWVRAASDAAGGSASGFGAGDSGWAGAGVPFPSNYRGAIWMMH